MLQPKELTVDNLNFHLQPLPVMKAMRLDKKVVSLILPIFGGMEGASSLDTGSLFSGISKALATMPDTDFESMVMELLSTTIYCPPGGSPETLNVDIINSAFQGKLQTIYKLLFEVMKYNKFSPFVLLEDGAAMNKILTSSVLKGKAKKDGEKLDVSETLLDA